MRRLGTAPGTNRRSGVSCIAIAALFLAVACVDSGPRNAAPGAGDDTGGTLVFSPFLEARSLDPAVAGTIVSLQVTYQLFETLVTLRPGGTDIVPSLARSWSTSDGQTWTFQLVRNARFHDGTPFNAHAVCANFDRWYNFRGALQSGANARWWREVFQGFATRDIANAPAESLYRSCEAQTDDEVVISLTRPSGAFLSGIAMPAFGIASPEALRRYEADRVSGTGQSLRFEGTFGSSHPIGTGPFKFDSWVRGESIVLLRNDDYWGAMAKLDRVIFRPIVDGTARRQALENGEVHAIEPVDPADIEPLRRAGFTLNERVTFSVGWVGFNQSRPPLDNLAIRQAIAHALNRDAVVRAHYQPSAVAAKAFIPPTVLGYADDVPGYRYDPDLARRLIAQSGVGSPAVELWYPTGLRGEPFLPDPEAVFQAFKADLERVGFTVVPKPTPEGSEYGAAVTAGQVQLWLSGDYGFRSDPDAWLTKFQRPSAAWGFDRPELFTLLDQAEAEIDQPRRVAVYQQANRSIMALLPGVPVVHVRPATALDRRVKGWPGGPLPWEHLALVSVK